MGTRRVRALLDGDRRAANEVRPEIEEIRLCTAEYEVPLRVRLKRRFREDDRVRLGSLVLSVGIVVISLGTLVSSRSTALASQDTEGAQLLLSREPLHGREPTPTVSYQPPAPPSSAAYALDRDAIPARLLRARRVLR
ncbi:MAG TPA: hypothetical protein VFZ61_13180, partial [Polyangiales bacterium]